jgi:purine-binding chemotaxis protein CheW
MEMSCIREIIKPMNVIQLLGAPKFVQGIAKVRDGMVTIIDLRKKFVITPASEGEPRIMIFESTNETERIGMWVDDVVEILESNSIQPIPTIIHHGIIKEVIRTKDHIIPILDIKQLFTNEVMTWLGSGDTEITDELTAVQDEKNVRRN